MTSREIDALIAKKVMELRFWIETRGEYSLAVWIASDKPEPWKKSRTPDPERYTVTDARTAFARGFFGTEPPRYSSDIAAAFLVVEKMHEQVYANSSAEGFPKPHVWPHANYLTLSCLSGSNDYAAAFTCVGENPEWHETPELYNGSRADSAPLAICLAALKALGVTVES